MRWRGVYLVAAQGASSAGNFLLAVLVARASNVNEFAAFALAFPLYALAAQFVRVAYLVPRQVRCVLGEGDIDLVEPFAPAMRALALLGAIGVGVGTVLGGTLGTWIVAVTLATFPTVAYDAIRNELIVRSREHRVAVYDLCWLAMQIAMVGIALLAQQSSGLAMFLAWALPPLFLTPAIWVDIGTPGLRAPRSAHRDWSTRVDGAVDLLGSVVVLQVIPYVILTLGGVSAAGGFRAGQMLLGPANVLVSGLAPLLQRSVAQMRDSAQGVRRLVLRHSAIIALLSFPYACIFLVIDDRIGTFILGTTWAVTAPLMGGLVLLMITRIPFAAVSIALRSLQAHGVLSRQRLVAYFLLTIGAVVGSTWTPIALLPVTMAFGALLTAAHGWRALVKTLQRRPMVTVGAR